MFKVNKVNFTVNFEHISHLVLVLLLLTSYPVIRKNVFFFSVSNLLSVGYTGKHFPIQKSKSRNPRKSYGNIQS